MKKGLKKAGQSERTVFNDEEQRRYTKDSYLISALVKNTRGWVALKACLCACFQARDAGSTREAEGRRSFSSKAINGRRNGQFLFRKSLRFPLPLIWLLAQILR